MIDEKEVMRKGANIAYSLREAFPSKDLDRLCRRYARMYGHIEESWMMRTKRLIAFWIDEIEKAGLREENINDIIDAKEWIFTANSAILGEIDFL